MKSRMLSLIAVSLLLGANLSYGYAVTVSNASFEIPAAESGWSDIGNGKYKPNTVGLDWSAIGTGAYGTWAPNTSSINAWPTIPNQYEIAYISDPNRQIEQQTGETIKANYTYTLTVQVGRRRGDTFAFGGGKIELLADGSPVNGLSAEINSLGYGQWAEAKFTFVANSLLDGKLLGIRLSTLGTGQAGFDMAAVTAVPLPAAAWLFGSALLGLGWTKRSRRQSQDALIA